MSDRMRVTATEHGVVRVFAIDLPSEQAADLADDGDLDGIRRALGATELDADFVEIFTVSDLVPMGLSGFLIEGMGVAPEELGSDAARLDAQKGYVAVVMSKAFGGSPQMLKTQAPLRWLGSWREERTPMPITPLRSASAKGLIPQGQPPKTPAPRRRWPMVLVALFGVLMMSLIAVMLAGTGAEQ